MDVSFQLHIPSTLQPVKGPPVHTEYDVNSRRNKNSVSSVTFKGLVAWQHLQEIVKLRKVHFWKIRSEETLPLVCPVAALHVNRYSLRSGQVT